MVKLPSRSTFTTFTGEVVWCRPETTPASQSIEVGIQFTSINPADRQALLQHLILNR